VQLETTPAARKSALCGAPINLRPMEDARLATGRPALVLLIGMDNPIDVFVVRSRMNALKGSLQPLLTGLLVALA
jgi:hypothetical protein